MRDGYQINTLNPVDFIVLIDVQITCFYGKSHCIKIALKFLEYCYDILKQITELHSDTYLSLNNAKF